MNDESEKDLLTFALKHQCWCDESKPEPCLLCYARYEIEYLRQAVQKVVTAIEVEGPSPSHHRRIMNQHRVQWPTLWKALDHLIEINNERKS